MGYGMNSYSATPIIARFPLDTLYSYFLCFILLLLAFSCLIPHDASDYLPIYHLPGLPHYLFTYVTSIAPHSVSIEEGMEAAIGITMNTYTRKSIWKY